MVSKRRSGEMDAGVGGVSGVSGVKQLSQIDTDS